MAKTTRRKKFIKDRPALEYIEKRLNFSLKDLLSFPKFFLIETTNICNARCVMCGIDFDKKNKAVMSEELFDKITSEIAQHNHQVEKVMLYLDCEPLLDKKLASRIQKMKEGGIKKVNIATNMSLLNSDKAVELIDAGLDEIYITIDSLKKEVFESIRPGLQFDTVYKNTLDFIKLRDRLGPGLIIRIQMILQELNQSEATSFTQHWRPFLRRNDQVIVQKAHNWGSTVKTMKFGGEDETNNVPCIALWSTLSIHVDGKVGLCCMDTNTDIPIGNLNLQNISQIWSGNPLENAREKHICGERTGISICNGCTTWRESKHDDEQFIT